ncbi:33398_t:CDS:2 [Gigaspora margarita]|uniref:33398_t:CDS:1 n=1 Tax=Gigaspora margarita TaxID=4874 RepID=A0ABN7UUE8_GIGMA|nr:33398_t:CDS:2 [Gigaspora margarita]
MPARIKDTDVKIWVYFIVPDDIYDIFKYQKIDDTNECTTITEKYTIQPDLFVIPQNIFQVTISQYHPIEQTLLVDIVKNIPACIKDTDVKIWFYFIVPDDIYDIFKYQKIDDTNECTTITEKCTIKRQPKVEYICKS